MVEIAICIAVVAFALVAIVGVLPTGFMVQKQNREETIVNQDGNLWLEAIRGGAIGLDYLTNHVEYIEHLNRVGTLTNRTYFSLTGRADGNAAQPFRNGRDIVGLLTLPRYLTQGQTTLTNVARAYVRAISGSAAEKAPQNEIAFQYRLTVELAPFAAVQFIPGNQLNNSLTNFTAPGLGVDEYVARSNLFVRTRNLRDNLFDLRVTLDWPVVLNVAGRRAGPNRKEFRTLVDGTLIGTNVAYLDGRYLPLIQPSEYLRTQ